MVTINNISEASRIVIKVGSSLVTSKDGNINERFLDSIEKLGFPYEFRKMTKNTKTLNKVLVGPFSTEKKAKDARRILRSKVEPGAFLVTL